MKIRDKILLLIIGSYLVGVIFTMFEFEAVKRHKWHPFYQGHVYEDGTVWNGHVTKAVFVYGFMEMVSRAMIFYAAYLTIIYRVPLYKIFILCFWVEVADMADYWLFRNDPYPFLPKWDTPIGTFAIEYNYIKLFIIGCFCWYEHKHS